MSSSISEYAAMLRKVEQLERNEAVLRQTITWQQENSRAFYEAFVAMRNDINELTGDMISSEATLLQGPEMAHECAAVVEAVRKALLRGGQLT